MTDEEIKNGALLIAKFYQWHITDEGNILIPNLYPSDEDSGWTETDPLATTFHKSWDMLHKLYQDCIDTMESLHDFDERFIGLDVDMCDAWGGMNINTVFDVVIDVLRKFDEEKLTCVTP